MQQRDCNSYLGLKTPSIAITAIMGLISSEILAEFSIALSFASIFFVMVTTIQMGVQAEFGRQYSEKNFKKLIETFYSVLIIAFFLSCLLIILAWLIPNPFSKAKSIHLSQGAYQAFSWLILSLPLIALFTTITFFLESINKILLVARLKIFQVVVQVCLVVIIIALSKFNFFTNDIRAVHFVMAYILSDALILVLSIFITMHYLKNNHYFNFIKKIKINFNHFLNILKLGLPVMFGMFGQKFIFYLYINFASSLGTVQASSFIIINSCIYFLQIPLLGIAHLMTIKISQSRNDISSELNKFFFQCFKLLVIEVLIMGLILIFLNRYIFQIFSNDYQVMQVIITLKWEVLLFFLMNVSLTFSMSCLRGYSDTFTPQIIVLTWLTAGFFTNNIIFNDAIDISRMSVIFSISGLIASYILIMRIVKFKKQKFTNRIMSENFIKV